MTKIKYPYEFDPKKRKMTEAYRKGKMILYLASLLLSLAISLAILFSGLHIAAGDVAVQYPLAALVNGFLILTIFTALKLPLNFYSYYVYEHRFRLSRYTIRSWCIDFLKFSFVNYAITLTLISLLYFSFSFSPWWLFAGIMYIMFTTAMHYIFPFVILPFLWKTKPYRDRAMKRRILELCRKLGVTSIRNIVVIKESEKSVKPNAMFTGLWNSKEICLFDNLLNNFTEDEVETVVGHELGHYASKDILRGLVLEALLIFPVLLAVDYFVAMTGPAVGISSVSDMSALTLTGLVYGAINFFLMPLVNSYSRHREARADEFALRYVRKPAAQISAEKRLADMHLSELEAHPLVEFWLSSHPSTTKRIRMAERWKESEKK